MTEACTTLWSNSADDSDQPAHPYCLIRVFIIGCCRTYTRIPDQSIYHRWTVWIFTTCIYSEDIFSHVATLCRFVLRKPTFSIFNPWNLDQHVHLHSLLVSLFSNTSNTLCRTTDITRATNIVRIYAVRWRKIKSITVALGNTEHVKGHKSESRFHWDSSYGCSRVCRATYAPTPPTHLAKGFSGSRVPKQQEWARWAQRK